MDIKNIVESAGGQVVQRRPSAKTIAAHVDEKVRLCRRLSHLSGPAMTYLNIKSYCTYGL